MQNYRCSIVAKAVVIGEMNALKQTASNRTHYELVHRRFCVHSKYELATISKTAKIV